MEFIGKRRGYGKGLFVGVNLGVPCKYDVLVINFVFIEVV